MEFQNYNTMREEFLHFIWKHKKFPVLGLHTTANESIRLVHPGSENYNSGPDFFNAQVVIGSQLWAGNVEIHRKTSDWYAHHHETDPQYQNVILHVVWEDDVAVYRKDSSEIPTLELKSFIENDILKRYIRLFQKDKNFINCEKELPEIPNFITQNWLDRLYFERLEQKSIQIFSLLQHHQNNWENVLFISLLKNFGLKVNGDAFYAIATALDFKIVQRLRNQPLALESILFGLGGLLETSDAFDHYYNELRETYIFMSHKYKLQRTKSVRIRFFRLRPAGFPTIRLSQMAHLYTSNASFFARIIAAKDLESLHRLLRIAAAPYWDSHYTFGKRSKATKKWLSRNFINLLIINTIIPIKFCYAQHTGLPIADEIVEIITEIEAEHNSLVVPFKKSGLSVSSALQSQAALQLYHEYCTKNNCLQCAIGNHLLRRID